MTEVDIVCTGRCRHAPVELGVISWQPGTVTSESWAVWGAESRRRRARRHDLHRQV